MVQSRQWSCFASKYASLSYTVNEKLMVRGLRYGMSYGHAMDFPVSRRGLEACMVQCKL